MKHADEKGTVPRVPSFLTWLYPYKIKKLPFNIQSPVLYYLFQNKVVLTFINWLFQGMRRMDRSDLTGKVILEILLFTLCMFLFNNPLGYRIAFAFAISHTINWLFNSHFWVFGRFLGITHTNPGRFFPYIRKLLRRVERDNSISAVIIIGSISRNQRYGTTSDVDIMFIRNNGFANAVKAALVTMRERAIAFLCKFPLHLEFYDGIESMERHRDDELPVLLKDAGSVAVDWYNKKGRTVTSLEEYEKGIRADITT